MEETRGTRSTTPPEAPSEPGVRVLVVDDEPLVRSGLTAVLSAAPDLHVVAAVGGGGALEAVHRHRVDVVLLDLRMPDVDGLTVLAGLSRLPRRPAVAVLTTFHADDQVAAALAAGADGYLLKDTDPDLLVRHVRELARGAGVLSPGVTAAVVAGFVRSRGSAPARQALRRLSPREHEVLVLLTEGAPNAEIARRLFVSVPTVKEHVGTVLAKLGVSNRVQAAVLAVRAGLADGA
ncbi:response regulator [Kineococcus sp. LSe6-4]|uniref:Response regulator n=1 Tax=Kineococcus halophytocola TaxID=3234027 RepID=A0ABV4H4W4_9ACTN